LHPTGASLTYFSSGHQQQNQARPAGIPIELSTQCFDILDICEWFSGSWGLTSWFKMDRQYDADRKSCKRQQAAFG